MSDFSINRLNSIPGLNQAAGAQSRQNVEKKPSLLGGGGTDSVQISFGSQLGTGGVNVADIVAGVSNLSLADAKAQLDPSTAFGLSLL